MKDSFSVSDIPPEEIQEVIEVTNDYLVALAAASRDQDGHVNVNWTASGMLATIGGEPTIITARHVAEALEREEPESVKIWTDFRKESATAVMSLDITHVRFVKSAKPASGKAIDGPDLALILLPDHLVGSISATKGFYNLDKRRDAALQQEGPPTTGFWLARGFPYELVTGMDGAEGFCFYCLNHVCYLSGSHEEAGHDYYDLEFDFTLMDTLSASGEHPELKTNQGMSGGPIWHVKVHGDSEGVPRIKDPQGDILLSGVIFYEYDLEKESKKFRCHGIRSVYKALYDLLKQQTD